MTRLDKGIILKKADIIQRRKYDEKKMQSEMKAPLKIEYAEGTKRAMRYASLPKMSNQLSPDSNRLTIRNDLRVTRPHCVSGGDRGRLWCEV